MFSPTHLPAFPPTPASMFSTPPHHQDPLAELAQAVRFQTRARGFGALQGRRDPLHHADSQEREFPWLASRNEPGSQVSLLSKHMMMICILPPYLRAKDSHATCSLSVCRSQSSLPSTLGPRTFKNTLSLKSIPNTSEFGVMDQPPLTQFPALALAVSCYCVRIYEGPHETDHKYVDQTASFPRHFGMSSHQLIMSLPYPSRF